MGTRQSEVEFAMQAFLSRLEKGMRMNGEKTSRSFICHRILPRAESIMSHLITGKLDGGKKTDSGSYDALLSNSPVDFLGQTYTIQILI